MLGFNHVLAGSIVAVLTPAPIVPVVSFLSHFLLDLTPHFGRSKTIYPYTKPFKRLLVIDGTLSLLGYLFAITLFPNMWFIIGVGVFFSILPDLLWIFWRHNTKWMVKFLDWAERIQWGERPYGWIFDIVYGVVMSITLYFLASQS